VTAEWPKGYRRGSTIFKEVLNKKGKLDYYVCAICDNQYEKDSIPRLFRLFEMHEIMHLLQQVRANFEKSELVMQGEDESK